jgi:small subunit ribosomal protein S20
MANTSSARKAARKIAHRAIINAARRTHMRNYVRTVEEAIASGDAAKARAALAGAEPEIMSAAQKGVIHRNTASRKISRLNQQVRKLGS